jgi:DNA-binding NtrC family response regulator
MKQIFGMLARLEGSLATVVLEGESGTGKEVIAEAIHSRSGVHAGPFVIVNCGAIPRDLVASELFGHVRGAFTGAIEGRRGAFESADGGTIFLDEVGELPLELQPVLLRVLEKGEVRPVGSDAAKAVRARVIAATNRDLELEVREGRFREDLFYRLAVVRLRIPPLARRAEDIEPIARKFAAEAGVAELPPDVIQKLLARAWPGNVRELRNAVQAYAALGVLPERTRSKPATLDLALSELVEIGVPYAEHKEILTERFTKIFLQVLLEKTGGNRTVAARLAGLDRTHLTRLLAKYGMTKDKGGS